MSSDVTRKSLLVLVLEQQDMESEENLELQGISSSAGVRLGRLINQ